MGDESDEIGGGLIAMVKSAIGKDADLEFVKKLKIEYKGERMETRIVALSTYRLYVLFPSKSSSKIDFSIHLLEIQAIESNKPLQISIICNDKSHSFRVQQANESTEIIAHILASLKSTFPAGNPDRLLRITYGPPDQAEERQEEVTTLVNNLRNAETDAEVGPCGGFSKVYESLCNYYGSRYLEEVAWDVDTIYLSHDTKEFNLQDFDHLEQKDLIPIISALEYNSWFTKFICVSYKLSSDVCDAIVRVVKKSVTLEELVLDGVSLGKEYSQKLALAVTSNAKTALHSLDLSNNSLEDRGVTHIAGTFSKLTHGLVSFTLADTGMTSRSCMLVGQSLKNSKYTDSSLKRLNISRNPLKIDGVSSLADFLAQPNSLTHVDLSSTECSLDLVFGALLRGCIQNLAHLNLSGNTFTSKKGKEVTVPPSFQKFFSSSASLKSLDVSDCKIPPEAAKAILTGLSENNLVGNVELNLSKNELRSEGAQVIAEGITVVKNVKVLDVSDNGFETDLIKIVDALGKNQSVTHLYIGQNISKGRHVGNIMEAIVKLVSEENSTISFLSLADSKLKHEVILLLDALGTNETLIELDLSGNHMGDEGARILAKALQLNTKLRTLHWDRNGTTYRGFGDIAAALESNHILHSMPTPLHDATQSLKLKPQTEQHLQQIEKLLLRNQSPSKIITEQAYRLQQALLISSTQQQAVDRLIVHLHDTVFSLRASKDEEVKKQIDLTKQCIQDADKLKQLLLKFYLCTNDAPVEERFAQLTADFHQAAQESMKGNIDKIMVCAREECPYITSQEDVNASLQRFDEGKARLSRTFVEEVILTQAAAAILNRVSEDKLTVASIVADTIMEIVIRHLETSSIKLDLLLKEHRVKVASGEEEAVFDNDSDIAVAARKAKNRLSSANHLGIPTNVEDRGGKPMSNKRRPTVTHRPRKETAAANGVLEVNENEKEEDEKPQLEVKLAAEPKPVELKLDVLLKQPKTKSSTTDFDFGTVEQNTGGNLTHLVKYRARPARGRRLPTRPSNRPAENGTTDDVEADDANIDKFWSQAPEADLNVNITPVKETKKTSGKWLPKAATKRSPKGSPKAAKESSKSHAPSLGKTPPKPAPKPRPANPSTKSQDTKKQGWMPKGGISIGIPGIFKKKNRDRSHSGRAEEEAKKSSWYTGENKPPAGEKKEEKKDEKKDENKPEKPRPRAPSASRPLPILRPEAVPRERTGTDPTVATKIPVPQPRERTQSATPTVDPAVLAAKKDGEKEEEKKEEETKPLTRGPPKFGVGLGMGMGMGGGGLFAEMKLRQERGASVGKKPTPEKKTEEKVQTKPVATEPNKDSPVVSQEKLVRPSSFKRNRLPSDTPPKPQPKPVISKKPFVLAPKPAQRHKKEEGAKTEVKVEKKEEPKEEEEKKKKSKEEEEEKDEAGKKVTKEEEKKEEKTETREKEEKQGEKVEIGKSEVDGPKADEAEKETEKKPEKGKEDNIEQDKKEEDESPWIRREMPQRPRSPRPLERSQSEIVPPVSHVEMPHTGRSATLPRPWAPSQPGTRSLPRKLSWELRPGPEKTEEEKAVEKEKEEEQKELREKETIQEEESKTEELVKLPEKPTTKLESDLPEQDSTQEKEDKQPEIQKEEKPAMEPVKKEEIPELNNAKEETTSEATTNGHKDETEIVAEMVDLSTETHL